MSKIKKIMDHAKKGSTTKKNEVKSNGECVTLCVTKIDNEGNELGEKILEEFNIEDIKKEYKKNNKDNDDILDLFSSLGVDMS